LTPADEVRDQALSEDVELSEIALNGAELAESEPEEVGIGRAKSATVAFEQSKCAAVKSRDAQSENAIMGEARRTARYLGTTSETLVRPLGVHTEDHKSRSRHAETVGTTDDFRGSTSFRVESM
jgi:hypothetical protein